MGGLRVFTFSADWGLPTIGPFALKLLAWLRLHDISFEQIFEDNPAKGPLGKSPWVEIDGRAIADTDVIITMLAQRHGIPIEEDRTREEALAGTFKTAFEERFHQILEWELFVHPAGAKYVDKLAKVSFPPVIHYAVAWWMKRHFKRQLYARGIARHDDRRIAELGRAEIDRLAMLLEGRLYLTGEEPVLADLAVFGQIAPPLYWPMRTPVAEYLKQNTTVRAWAERIKQRCFG